MKPTWRGSGLRGVHHSRFRNPSGPFSQLVDAAGLPAEIPTGSNIVCKPRPMQLWADMGAVGMAVFWPRPR